MMKKIMIGLLIFVCLFVAGALTYRVIKTQGVTSSYTINQYEEGFKKVLIATQQKEFKDSVMENIKNYYAGKPVAIHVIDVTTLNTVKIEDWDGIILFTTIQSSKPPLIVTEFLNKQKDLSNVFMMLTADSGKWNRNTYDMDVVTSASRKKNITPITDTIIDQINAFAN